jgi:hypothetical protein
MRKKKWTAPLLTVIVRGRPEERVLSACKGDWNISSYNNDYSLCSSIDMGGCNVFCYATGSS